MHLVCNVAQGSSEAAPQEVVSEGCHQTCYKLNKHLLNQSSHLKVDLEWIETLSHTSQNNLSLRNENLFL